MHKVLWDAVVECRIHMHKRNIDEWAGYCAGCPLGSECSESEELGKLGSEK